MVMSVNEKMTAIADAIRDKTGGTEALTLDDMASAVPEVFNTGKKSEYDTFWDTFQQNGNRTSYNSAFGGQWTTDIFKPKYPIRPTNAYMMFFSNTQERLVIPDFVQYCEENNIILDMSNASGIITYALAGLHTHHFGTLDFSCKNESQTVTLSGLFYSHSSQSGVRKIDNFISSERTIYQTNTFQAATYLEELNMSGVIATNDFNVQYCTLLSHNSLISIINALKDYSEDTSGTVHKVTLGATNIAKLTEAEIEIIRTKGWQYA